MFSKINFLVFSSFLLIIYSCINNNEVNSDTIIQVGNTKISYYEYSKEFDRQKNEFENQSDFTKNLINNLYFINDGYSLGFGNNELLQKRVESIADFMMVQKYGYLWKATVSPIVDNFDKMTTESLKKRSVLYYFDCIDCSELDSLNNLLLSKDFIDPLQKFKYLKSICKRHSYLNNSYLSLKWPFGSLFAYNDILYSMNIGEVSPILKLDNTAFILLLDHKEKITVTNEDKENLKTEMQIFKEMEIDNFKTIEMDSVGEFEFYYQNIDSLYDHIQNNRTIKNFNNNLNLMKFNFNNKSINLDYNVFSEYLLFLPYMPQFNSKSRLIEMLKQYYYDAYLKEEAIKLGLYQSKMFLLDKRNYKNKLILQQYIQTNFVDSIIISENQKWKYYQDNIQNFLITNGIDTHILYFKDRLSAEECLIKLNKKNTSFHQYFESTEKINDLIGLKYSKKHYIIDKNQEQFFKSSISELDDLQDSSLFNKIIPNNEEFLVLYKISDISNYLKDYESVSNEIGSILFSKELENREKKKLIELKKKYPHQINKTGVKI